MPEYIALINETPIDVAYLITLAPQNSYPDVITIENSQAVVDELGYAVCTVADPPVPEWNQTLTLGVASLVSGALVASWSAVNMSNNAATYTLNQFKSNGVASIETAVDALNATSAVFENDNGSRSVTLSPDIETLLRLIAVTLAATNANASASIVDVNGAVQSLTLAQLKEITASLIETYVDRRDGVLKAKVSISNATTPTQVSDIVTNWNDDYGP